MGPERDEKKWRRRRKRRDMRRKGTGKETSRGALVEVTRVGGGMRPTQRKSQTSQDSPQKVRTCCYRKCMETSCITMTGRTWTGESWTTMYGSVIGTGLLLSWRAGTPHPPKQWGAASRKYWPRNGGGFLIGVRTLRDPSSLPTSFLQRCWAPAGTKRSGPGLRGAWTSGRGVCMRVWWGMLKRKGPPGRAGPPPASRRRTNPWPGVTTTQCFLVSSGKSSVGQPTVRGEGVSS